MKARIWLALLIIPIVSRAQGLSLGPNPRFTHFGTPIPAHASLDVRWNTGTHPFPSRVGVYELRPRPVSADVLLNLMQLGLFNDRDEIKRGNVQEFRSSDGTRHMLISPSRGSIYYERYFQHGSARLAHGVPDREQAIALTKLLLPQLGINIADLDRNENSEGPDFQVGDRETVYFDGHTFVTNVELQRVSFRRAIDGKSFLSAGTGGDGDIEFGSEGQIVKINVSWLNPSLVKSYTTLAPAAIVKELREGRAVHGMIPMNVPEFDWSRVKSVTVNQAWICYFAGDPLLRSRFAYPFACLAVAVDTGHGVINVEIDCPIYDADYF